MSNRSVPAPDDEVRPSGQPSEIVRAFLLTYTQDRLGRPASVTSRALAHDALDQLEAAAKAAA